MVVVGGGEEVFASEVRRTLLKTSTNLFTQVQNKINPAERADAGERVGSIVLPSDVTPAQYNVTKIKNTLQL